ncbi:MAG TPA: beta-glucosidase [Clostridiales bacterium]|nr:beta-glucosidase [Clostridiales bacterium]
MRTKLTDKKSIKNVIKELTLDEKLNLVGEYTACHTMAIEDMDIPSIYLLDGATGVNGAQMVLDFISTMQKQGRQDIQQKIYTQYRELSKLNYGDLEEAKERYREDADILSLIASIERFRPKGKQFMSFPSGINIGAAFDPEQAETVGTAIGWELRSSGVDLCMGPNVDISRDPLGGRGYEMYGEDPQLVGEVSAAVVKGIQRTGTGACAKHYLANNQETNRNTKDTHVSERVLRELYARGFISAIKEGNVKSVMTAYNAINGEFTSFSKKLMTDWLRGEFGFEGLVVCDWGAVKENKEKSLDAGMDLILCGPNDMSGVKAAIEAGSFSEEVLDCRVEKLLETIVWLREEQEKTPLRYDLDELKQTAYETIVEGSVLLKNENQVLPLSRDEKVTFYGRRSKEFMECGTGSTAVETGLHSNVFDEYQKLSSSVTYETMEGADVVVYTVTAPAGENIDRREMDIEKEDRLRLTEVLKEAKAAGRKTVVLLNVAGPIDMRSWIDYADSVLSIFIPGCMGGVAAAKLLCGEASPGGRLPVTFPLRIEDTPSYPNFPGEHNDVYYGEGLFVGYKNYEKRKLGVMYPFGYGLSYTEFEEELLQDSYRLDVRVAEAFQVPVRVKNKGSRTGSQVIQVYSTEVKPHVLRPAKELAGFAKVTLSPGEEKEVQVTIKKDALAYYDIEKKAWIQPVGEHKLSIGTSSAHIFAEAPLTVEGENAYKLGGESLMIEIFRSPEALAVIDKYTNNMMSSAGEEAMAMMAYNTLSDFLGMTLISRMADAVKLNEMLQALYAELGTL